MVLPLLCSLVVDEISCELNHGNYSYYIGGYADIANLIIGKFTQTVAEVLQTVLGIVQQWCNMTYLAIKPNKIIILSCNHEEDIKGLKELTLKSPRAQHWSLSSARLLLSTPSHHISLKPFKIS